MITCPPRLRQLQLWPNSSVGRNSALTCTTWRERPTENSSEPDPLEDALGDLVRAAQRDLDGGSRIKVHQSEDRGELVERADFLSFILMASGYRLKDFKVKVVRGELIVQAPDFELTRALGCEVESAGIRTDYRNGVLNVRIAKKF